MIANLQLLEKEHTWTWPNSKWLWRNLFFISKWSKSLHTDKKKKKNLLSTTKLQWVEDTSKRRRWRRKKKNTDATDTAKLEILASTYKWRYKIITLLGRSNHVLKKTTNPNWVILYVMMLNDEVYFISCHQDYDWPLRKRQGPVPVPILQMHFTYLFKKIVE